MGTPSFFFFLRHRYTLAEEKKNNKPTNQPNTKSYSISQFLLLLLLSRTIPVPIPFISCALFPPFFFSVPVGFIGP